VPLTQWLGKRAEDRGEEKDRKESFKHAVAATL
jgi:hypothetical protein